MTFKRYKHLNVPDSWERYFTKYPQGMSILESLFEWVSQVDSMVDNQNKLSANVEQFRIEIDAFVGRFDERLQTEVSNTLTDWQNSGFLDVVINEALQWQLDDYIATNEQDKLSLTAQLAQMVINVKSFGAIGDGVSYDDVAINSAISEASKYVGATLFFPYSFGYRTQSSVNIPANINVIMESPVILNNNNIPAIVVGGIDTVNANIKLNLRTIKEVQSTWVNENEIGIRIYNANTCEIIIKEASNFYVGVEMCGDSNGFAYNEVTLHSLRNNKYALDITNSNSGWTNENNFYGGRFSVQGSVNTNANRYGVRITSKDSDYKNNNNNFYKPSFELTAATGNEAIPFLIEHGSYNHCVNARNENNSNTFARILNDSVYNIFDVGYGQVGIEDLSVNTTNFQQARVYAEKNFLKVESFKSGSLVDNLNDDGAVLTVPNMFFVASSTGATLLSSNDYTVNDYSVTIGGSRLLSKRFNTHTAKRFLIKKDADNSNPGQVLVRCFDENMTHLTDVNNLIKGKTSQKPYYTTQYGGGYNSSPSNTDYYFTVAENVKYIDICVSGSLYSFNVYTDELSTPFMI